MDWAPVNDLLYSSHIADDATIVRAGGGSLAARVILGERENPIEIAGGMVIARSIRAWVRSSVAVRRGDFIQVKGRDYEVVSDPADTGAGDVVVELRRRRV